METLEILNNIKRYFETTSHPQINSSEVKLIEKANGNGVATYLNNIIEDGSDNNQEHPVLFVSIIERNGNSIIFYRILNIPADTRFFHKDTFSAEFILNRILLDLPNNIGSFARVVRNFEKGELEIHLFSKFYPSDAIQDILESDFIEIFHLMNRILFEFYKVKLNSLSDLLSESQREEKIKQMWEKIIKWTLPENGNI